MADDNEERKDGGSEREPLLRTSPSAAVLERRASYPGATTQHPTFGGSGDDDGSGASSDMARRGSYILRHSLQKAKEETKAKKRWADNVDELCALKDEDQKFSVSFEEFVPYDMREEYEWVSCNDSIYGHAIAVLLCSPQDILEIEGKEDPYYVISWVELQAFINVYVVGGVQGVILYYLWKDMPLLEDTKFCREGTHNGVFFVSAVAVFLLSLMKSFWKIYECVQMLDSTHRFGYDRDTGEAYVSAVKVRFHRYIPAALICAWIMVAWIVILIVGTYAIISDESVVDTVVMTVSISFITELDTMAMELYNRQFRTFTESNRFRTKRERRSSAVQDVEVVVTTVALSSAAITIVYVLYYVCPQGFNWHNDWDDAHWYQKS